MTRKTYSNLLAIDTSSRRLLLGLSFGGDRLVKSDEAVEQSHGQLLIKKIAALFSSAGLGPGDLDGIVACTGPGSFTGLRIGLAAAKGMAVATAIDVVGVSLFETAAHRLSDVDGTVIVVVPLRRGEYAVGQVGGGRHLEENLRVASDGELEELLAGSRVATYHMSLESGLAKAVRDDLSSKARFDAADLIAVGREKLLLGKADELTALEPLYIQKSQAEIKFERRKRK
ncbi:MAG: tRNA (adenosine(37)-N6)-threonylcarbamoyltransferase complex dimerization subunit type 1 TsaB [Candidatus Zixiibacteriota bacterium]|nr:MAG: tRNA (adenosine(37)-N6)-threonylcarbamoyltransferase complex dimerization subunit type 1 TsaB [candidate division Zixibacteria bacterium]